LLISGGVEANAGVGGTTNAAWERLMEASPLLHIRDGSANDDGGGSIGAPSGGRDSAGNGSTGAVFSALRGAGNSGHFISGTELSERADSVETSGIGGVAAGAVMVSVNFSN